jgi:hypothetical protein
MTPHGLIKATAYYNNLQAWADWRALAEYALTLDLGDLVKQYEPEPGAGWRKVDKSISALRAEVEKAIKI